jgi:vitamin B12 transporter
MRRILSCFAVLLFALLPDPSWAESQLTVTVADPSSTPIAGASVLIYPERSQEPLAVRPTSAQGAASFSGLPAGRYRVDILAPGFAKSSSVVTLPESSTLAVQLAIAVPAETVVVTATGTPTPADQTGTAIEVLDRGALQNMQPVSASDALRFLPGAIVNSAGRLGGQASLFVRGGESRYNKVLIDGVPVNDPGGTYDFGVLPLTSVERMEFVRGPESLLYGSDAMTSVVQMWSATGHTRVPQLELGADGGNYSTARGYASLAGANGRFDYNLFAQEDTSQGQGINDAYSNGGEGANLGVALSKTTALRLRVRHFNSRVGVQGEWNFNGTPLLAPDSDAFARQNDLIASASLTIASPSRWQHSLTAFEYHHLGLNQDTFIDPGRGCDFVTVFIDCPFSSPFDINRAGFDYQGDWSPRNWAHTTIGSEFEDENGAFNSTFALSPGVNGYSDIHGLRRNFGTFAEQLLMWRRFTLLAGGRFEHNESFGNRGVPRAALTFRAAHGGEFFSGTRFRAGYSEGIKEPRFEESFGISGTYPASPNPNLRPEQNRSLEAGVEQAFLGGKYFATALYYNNLFRDQIAFEPGPNFIGGQYVNIAEAMAHGAELELHGRISPSLLLSSAYVYTSSQVLANPLAFDPYLPGEPLLRRPKHAGSLLLNYVGRHWGGELGGSFVGRRADSDFLGFGINHAAGYALVNLGGWFAVNHIVTAYANLDNALDRHYQEVVGYPALGINARAGLRFRFGGE